MFFRILFLFFLFLFIPSTFANSGNISPKQNIGDIRFFEIFPENSYFYNPTIWQDDENILRFVSIGVPLTHRNYKPKKLISLSGSYIDQKGRNNFIRADIKPHLDILAQKFSEHFCGEPLTVVSGYRSAESQQFLWKIGYCDEGALCAKPGESEHQLGLALDFFDAPSKKSFTNDPNWKKYIDWLDENAHKYGWTKSYQNGANIDGYNPEPWHWRYIGVPTATLLHQMQISYSQYIFLLQSLWKFSR